MPLSARSGFTLIEGLVAIILVAIGVLSAVASSAVVVREADEGRSATLAASAAVNRVEALRSHPCDQESGHSVGIKGISESWTSSVAASGARNLTDSVGFVVAGTPRSFVLRAQAWC